MKACRFEGLILFIFLLAVGAWSKAEQSAPFCQRAYQNDRFYNRNILEKPTDEETLKTIEALSDATLVHYTTQEGLLSISTTQRILPDPKNRVYFTREGMTPREAEQNLFIGAPTHLGKADFVIMVRKDAGSLLEFSVQNPLELIHRGAYRFKPEQVIYAGPNPF